MTSFSRTSHGFTPVAEEVSSFRHREARTAVRLREVAVPRFGAIDQMPACHMAHSVYEARKVSCMSFTTKRLYSEKSAICYSTRPARCGYTAEQSAQPARRHQRHGVGCAGCRMGLVFSGDCTLSPRHNGIARGRIRNARRHAEVKSLPHLSVLHRWQQRQERLLQDNRKAPQMSTGTHNAPSGCSGVDAAWHRRGKVVRALTNAAGPTSSPRHRQKQHGRE